MVQKVGDCCPKAYPAFVTILFLVVLVFPFLFNFEIVPLCVASCFFQFLRCVFPSFQCFFVPSLTCPFFLLTPSVPHPLISVSLCSLCSPSCLRQFILSSSVRSSPVSPHVSPGCVYGFCSSCFSWFVLCFCCTLFQLAVSGLCPSWLDFGLPCFLISCSFVLLKFLFSSPIPAPVRVCKWVLTMFSPEIGTTRP